MDLSLGMSLALIIVHYTILIPIYRVEAYAGGAIYTATKHAVHAFTASMMRELVNTPIRVTEILPGKGSSALYMKCNR